MGQSKKQYRVGLVGFGFMGRVNLYSYINLPLHYSPLPFGARITHLCTGHRESADAACAEFGIEHGTTDFREITENPDIDIVHICSPNSSHCEQLISALEAGKHIYCDKPLVATVEEAEQIRPLLKGYSGTFGMTFQNRFFPAAMRARQLVQDAFPGRILNFRAAYLHSGSINPEAPLKWKLSGQSGGGVIADLGSHVLDLVSWLVGDYVEVCGCSQIAYDTRPDPAGGMGRLAVDAEDGCYILAKMKPAGHPDSLALGSIEATKLSSGSEDELRLEISGTQGGLRFNSLHPGQLGVFEQGESDRPVGGFRGWTYIETGHRFPPPASGFPGPKYTVGCIRVHMANLAEFLYAVHEKREFQPGAAQGIYIQHVMNCVKQSIQGRRWVAVPERTGR